MHILENLCQRCQKIDRGGKCSYGIRKAHQINKRYTIDTEFLKLTKKKGKEKEKRKYKLKNAKKLGHFFRFIELDEEQIKNLEEIDTSTFALPIKGHYISFAPFSFPSNYQFTLQQKIPV